ncbi:hypothetical protein Tco_0336182 [Tanacetum coccineum]
MANIRTCNKHNMIACVEKTEHNADFHQIVDYLTGCSINYSLLVDPDLIDSFTVLNKQVRRSNHQNQSRVSSTASLLFPLRLKVLQRYGSRYPTQIADQASISQSTLLDFQVTAEAQRLKKQTIFSAKQSSLAQGQLKKLSRRGTTSVVHQHSLGKKSELKKRRRIQRRRLSSSNWRNKVESNLSEEHHIKRPSTIVGLFVYEDAMLQKLLKENQNVQDEICKETLKERKATVTETQPDQRKLKSEDRPL